MSEESKQKAKDLWDKLSAIVESTCNDFETLKPILREIAVAFGFDSKIGHEAILILLSEADFDMVKVDNLRYSIHEFWEGRLKNVRRS